MLHLPRASTFLVKLTMMTLTLCLGMVPLVTLQAEEARIRSHSFAHPEDIVMTHLDLDLRVDFASQRLIGTATLDIDNRTEAKTLFVDTWRMKILGVTLDDGTKASFHLGEEHDVIGSPLAIEVHLDTRQVRIAYETTAGARALQWLLPAQTRDQTQPFLYTQSQSINARSWVPCQDVPSVRFTYHARLEVPPGLMAIMSAHNTFEKSTDGVYDFEMLQPIPAYLLALAVGDFEFQSISARSGVFTEPSLLEAAAWEFADVENMMQVAEELYGPYRWERFDSIVLPPSFPFGGMENPRVTFLTPTIVAGDRSLVSTVAHELAHSWSGNLVTNAAWEDFWLNEGFTTYFDQRIMEQLFGRDISEMHAVLGLDDLREEIEHRGEASPLTALYVELDGLDPDEALGVTAYQKGYLFLRLLEESVGRATWDVFLRKYFDAHAFESMTTRKFLAYLQQELFAGDAAAMEKLQVDTWVYSGGLPSNAPLPHSVLLDQAQQQVDAWDDGASATSLQVEDWATQQWDYFLTHINKDIRAERLADLDKTFSLHASNGLLQRSWFLLVINNAWEPGYASLESFLVEVGRRWLIRPLYVELAKTKWGEALAMRVYAVARAGYHPLTVHTIDETIGWQANR